MTFSNEPPFVRFLQKLLSHSALNAEEQQAILGLPVRPFQVRANADIVRLGETVDHACLVFEGLVGRFEQTHEGQRQITSLHVPGDMVDLHSVVVPRSSSALQALSTTTVLRVPHAELRRLAETFPGIGRAFWRECSVDAAILSQWVANVGRRNAQARLAHLLCEMAILMEAAGLGSRSCFRLEATQTHLADALGLTSVHVNRTLKGLKDTGVVSIEGRNVHIENWDALTRLGDFDAAYLHLRRPEAGDVNAIRASRSDRRSFTSQPGARPA
jgi:CRP-like cAMP-binding protein